MMSLWELEHSARDAGYHTICGCDEAGAGPLAGPVYAAAVILPMDLSLPYLNDSKQVTEKRREVLFDEIRKQAVAYAITSVSPQEIDELDILNARIKAMQMAIDALSVPPDLALIDGNRDHGNRCALITPHELVIHGDSRSANIAAASILAKVSRDRYMREISAHYPQYQFEKHKGYGTKLHTELLNQYGPSPIHRRSFLRKWEARQNGRAKTQGE